MLQSSGCIKGFLHFSYIEGDANNFTRTGRRNIWLRLCMYEVICTYIGTYTQANMHV